ncbi:hypothetical protein MHY1_00687 [Methylovirgula sp. HY1]|nr:hypothetical protein MHY1_00687 [Methylovirgula sp. HY1]
MRLWPNCNRIDNEVESENNRLSNLPPDLWGYYLATFVFGMMFGIFLSVIAAHR